MRVPYKGVGWLVIICWVPELFQHLQEGCGILSWPTWLAPWRHDDGGWWWDFHLTQNRDTTWKPKKNGCQKKKNEANHTKNANCACFLLFLLWGLFFVGEQFLLYVVSKMRRRFVFEYWTPFVNDASAVTKDGILGFDKGGCKQQKKSPKGCLILIYHGTSRKKSPHVHWRKNKK